MDKILLLAFIAGLLFLFFLFFILKGLRGKNKKSILISLGFLLFTLIISFWAIYLFVSKAYDKVTDTFFKPRSGIEIYTALFGNPKDNCVTVTNNLDQLVPRLDCCIWLEFKTCPTELNRIIGKEPYKMTKYFSADTSFYVPAYTPKPFWWRPNLLGDSVTVMQNYNPDNPNRDQILIFSKDSLHAFYCDMAD
jgi:energy-coupling factor transporter transmembrane protein EcfT